MYYRYWMHKDHIHAVWSHYGVRTKHHKLICYYADALDTWESLSHRPAPDDYSSEEPEWECFDLRKDPQEMISVYDDPDYEGIVAELKLRLQAEMLAVDDVPHDHPACAFEAGSGVR